MIGDVIVLAGGKGTRMRKVWSGPKCLAPIHGRPFLHYLLSRIEAEGGQRIILALACWWAAVWESVQEYEKWFAMTDMQRPEILKSIELDPRGIASAVRTAAKSVKSDVAVVMNGDTWPIFDVAAPLLDAWREEDFSVAIYDSESRLHTGIVLMRRQTARRWESNDLTKGARKVYVEAPFVDLGSPEGYSDMKGVLKP